MNMLLKIQLMTKEFVVNFVCWDFYHLSKNLRYKLQWHWLDMCNLNIHKRNGSLTHICLCAIQIELLRICWLYP